MESNLLPLEWHNEKRKVKDLVPFEFNPRKLSEEKKQLLINSIEKFNLAEVPAINLDNVIIAGHQRIKVLMELGRGEEEIDVRLPNRLLNEKEYKEYNITSNIPVGFWDVDVLDESFSDINLEELGLFIEDGKVVFEDYDKQEAKIKVLEAEEDDFDVPDGGSETDIVLGDLFEIGQHRLLCGDSTCSDTVAKLMNGEKADMVFTDPSYLMDFKGNVSWDKKNGTQPTFNAVHGQILNDKMSEKEGEDFLDAINTNISLFCNGAFYITFYRLGIDKYFESLKRTGLKCRSLIIWNKLNHTLSNSDYMSRYEPIFYGWVNDHKFYGGNNGMDIWDIERTRKNELHPTMKPISLCEKAINDGSRSNDKVLDLFLGSGSTMVASEQLNRKCYGMELNPKYCQVIVDRMMKLNPELEVKRNGLPYIKSDE